MNKNFVAKFWQNVWRIPPGFMREQILNMNIQKFEEILFGLLFSMVESRNIYIALITSKNMDNVVMWCISIGTVG